VKPDVIVCWPRNCDYPLWRAFIRTERERFGRVFVAFTEHDGRDYSGWIADHFGEATCFWAGSGTRDWRDHAVNAVLDQSTAEWVWFTEQDFLIGDRGFWDGVEWASGRADAMGWRADNRWHPSCLFARREAIERTSRYFGPDPVDHFYRFDAELGPILDLVDIAGVGGTFEHLQGLSQNHYLLETTGSLNTPGIFRPRRFARYLQACLASGVPLHPVWEATIRGADLSTAPHPIAGAS
jgi:hypothetical protein